MQQIKFERARVVKPQPSRIHFYDGRPYHQNKVSCPDLIIDTQLTNITLNRLEVSQSIPRCDDYYELNRACFMRSGFGKVIRHAHMAHNLLKRRIINLLMGPKMRPCHVMAVAYFMMNTFTKLPN